MDRIYLYAKDPYVAKYQFLINKRESKGLKHFNDLNSTDMRGRSEVSFWSHLG